MRGSLIALLVFAALTLWMTAVLVDKMQVVTGKVESVRIIYSQPESLEELDEQSVKRQADSLANFLR